MDNNRKISVLLVRQHSKFSNLVYVIGGGGYTHAALSLDDAGDEFYSFNFRGFCVEHPRKRIHRRVRKSVFYQFDVTEEDYMKIKEQIDRFLDNPDRYNYNRLGVLLCVLRIPFTRKKSYFCSQFVAEMLHLCDDAIILNKKSSLYMPNHLTKELALQPSLSKVIYNTL